ncbi:hypothetical protein EG244_19305 [Falsigemmobacter faecalis]|uniref:Solute-binding protein family 5 domain-containing protein n=1 Tax=Falsigemmobacter faecalis TaxID=2488730 RepID=A0A3P3D446_9RHOB|nr:hypothetical protein EG244_19305 [Falsigemmobacter faecalis]
MEENTMKTRNFLMIATSCLAGMAGSALSAQTRSLVVAEVNDVTTFDPHQATDNTTISINDHIFEGLVALVEDGSFQPRLAESWTISDDQLTWTFKLRQGVKFSDGADFNAATVKTNIERIVDPAFGSPGRARLNLLESTEVVDDYTVAFKTKVPWPALMDGLAGNSTRILSPRVLGSDTDVNKTPIGTGPFMLESSRPNQGTTLVVNPGYWGDAPKLEKITITTVPDAAVRATLLQAGEIDLALKVNPENVATLEADPAISVAKSPSTFSVFYMFNMREKPFDDPRVRKALNMAIDREAIVGSLLQGAGIVPRSIFAGSVPYRVELPAIEYNP